MNIINSRAARRSSPAWSSLYAFSNASRAAVLLISFIIEKVPNEIIRLEHAKYRRVLKRQFVSVFVAQVSNPTSIVMLPHRAPVCTGLLSPAYAMPPIRAPNDASTYPVPPCTKVDAPKSISSGYQLAAIPRTTPTYCGNPTRIRTAIGMDDAKTTRPCR